MLFFKKGTCYLFIIYSESDIEEEVPVRGSDMNRGGENHWEQEKELIKENARMGPWDQNIQTF